VTHGRTPATRFPIACTPATHSARLKLEAQGAAQRSEAASKGKISKDPAHFARHNEAQVEIPVDEGSQWMGSSNPTYWSPVNYGK